MFEYPERKIKKDVWIVQTASVVQWSEFLATDPEISGSISGSTTFSGKQWVWNGIHSAS
jgi:hypothetical protein